MAEYKTYNLDEIPDEAKIYGGKTEYEPLDDSQIYQVELLKVEFQDSPFKDADGNKKFSISFEFAVLDDAKYYGRRLWKSASPSSMKPSWKGKDPGNLYKIVTKILKTEMSWEDCHSFAPITEDNSGVKMLMQNLISNCVGSQLKVGIENQKGEDGKIRTKIKTFYESKEDLPAFDQEKSKAMGEKFKNAPDGSEDVKVGEPLPF